MYCHAWHNLHISVILKQNLIECLLQLLNHDPECLDPGVLLIHRLEDMPRRIVVLVFVIISLTAVSY